MHAEQQNRRWFFHSVLYAVITLLVFFLALAYCRYQQVFTVKTIVVHGYHELSEKHITRISGIKRGANMFDLDMSAGIKRLIDEPYIYNAYVSRQFPDIINIYVIERQPVVFIKLRDNYALDAFATVLPMPYSYAVDSLPVIEGVDPDLVFEPGKPTFHPDIRHAINFINYVQSFRNDVTDYCNNITWSDEKGWLIQKNADYPPVYLGKDQLKKRIDILNAFIIKMEHDNIDMRRFRYVSLRFNGQVIIRDKI